MHVLITGGTGLIGRRLIDQLFKHGHTATVLSRRKYRPATLPSTVGFARWDGQSAEGWGHLVEEAEALVNLAGAGVADEKWTDERKRIIRHSRLEAGKAVIEAIRAAQNKPKVLIQASAVGYYGPNPPEMVTEESPPGRDFLADVCVDWEQSTAEVEEMGVRRVIIRTGVVLDMAGGALPKMLIPFRLVVAGGPIGSGRQWLPWIHYLDEAEAIRFLLEHETASGPFNLTAPKPVRNKEFVRTIGKVLKRPAFAPAPGFIFKAILGEMATVLLDGQPAVPHRLLDLGYDFKFSTVEAALVDLLKPPKIDIGHGFKKETVSLA